MPRNMVFAVLAAAFLGAVISVPAATPADAQASCMHCSFQAAKCKRIGTMGPAKCEERRLSCVKACKASAASAGSADKVKSADKGKNSGKK